MKAGANDKINTRVTTNNMAAVRRLAISLASARKDRIDSALDGRPLDRHPLHLRPVALVDDCVNVDCSPDWPTPPLDRSLERL